MLNKLLTLKDLKIGMEVTTLQLDNIKDIYISDDDNDIVDLSEQLILSNYINKVIK